ncbi:MAG: kinase/pyrophosphorylase [Proteobacteria bacterium]|nr:kinase/pyrophosphorylase [Pseudomonadota bacterium]
MPNRSVFFLSDSTGITAETFGHAILAQFAVTPRQVRLPFVNSADKARQAVAQINQAARTEGKPPIVFSTVVNEEVLAIIQADCRGLLMDLFGTFVAPLERTFNLKSNHRVGRFSETAQTQAYLNRIDAINFTLAHDDGQSARDLASAEVILVGVSRSGKTPTSLYLAMQYGIKASNYPLIPEDFERQRLPQDLIPYRQKLFGLTIEPQRLANIRHERRPDSTYASLANCQYEVAQAEAMMRREGIQWLSSTTKSIEEIATTVLQQVLPQHLNY